MTCQNRWIRFYRHCQTRQQKELARSSSFIKSIGIWYHQKFIQWKMVPSLRLWAERRTFRNEKRTPIDLMVEKYLKWPETKAEKKRMCIPRSTVACTSFQLVRMSSTPNTRDTSSSSVLVWTVNHHCTPHRTMESTHEFRFPNAKKAVKFYLLSDHIVFALYTLAASTTNNSMENIYSY